MAHSEDSNSNSSFDEQEQEQDQVEMRQSAGAPLLDVLALMKKEKFQLSLPDAVSEQMLQASGCTSSDPKVTKLISLAAQTFMAVLAKDTLQHYKMRGAPQSSKFKGKDGKEESRNVLLMEDLATSVAEHGLIVRKPPYFV